MITDARFDACLPYILKEEGGNDDDPHDHGGRTSRGITQREYNAAGFVGDVWKAPDEIIRGIYYKNYWLPRCPHLSPGVDLVYFNFCVNAGPGRAEKLLMQAIGGSDEQTIEKFCGYGMNFYRSLAQFSRYGHGWTTRTMRIEIAAKKMIDKPVPEPAPNPTKPVAAPKVWWQALLSLFFKPRS